MSDEVVQTREIHEVMPGVEWWTNVSNGFTVIDLKYKADPSKRSEDWYKQARAGMPAAEWEREFGDTWIVYEGKPVYGDYDEEHHLYSGTIRALRRSRLISGWDAGPNDVNLAWCLGLVAPGDQHLIIIDEYQVDDGDVQDFVQVVNSRLRLEWYKLGGFSIHVADQSVFTKSGISNSSVADLMRQHGFSPIPGEISFAKRRAAVERLLATHTRSSVDNIVAPHLRVHERCVLLREALKGGYCYAKVAGGIGGNYKETPIKNKFSHVTNALEYVCSRVDLLTTEVPYASERLPSFALV